LRGGSVGRGEEDYGGKKLFLETEARHPGRIGGGVAE